MKFRTGIVATPFLSMVAFGLNVLAILAYQQEDSMVRRGGIEGSGVVTSKDALSDRYSPAAGRFAKNRRKAQEEPNYFADYVGRFQYERSALCRGAFPEVKATCRGTIELQRVSSESYIVCEDVVQNEDKTTSISCATTCNLNQCLDVFLSLDREGLVDGSYGEVYFRCSGETILEAEGSFSYLETGTGDCAPYQLPNTRNFHIAQMGVLCEEKYSFDSFFFECSSSSFISTIMAPDGSVVYTCVTGENCQGQECVVVFEDIVIDAEIQNFQDSCVSSPNGLALTSSPTPPPQERRRKLVAEFNFIFGADTTVNQSPVCGIEIPTVTVRCTNGEIAFVDSTLGVNPCDKVDDQTLICNGNSNQNMLLAGNSHTVTYVCTSSTSPLTTAELSETEASCPSMKQYGVLGVYCSATRVPDFIYIDRFFECGRNIMPEVRVQASTNRLSCVSNTAEAIDDTLSGVLVMTGLSWKAQPFIGSCTMASTPSSTTAPSVTVIDNVAAEDAEADNGSGTIITVVSVVGALALVILFGIFYVINRNKPTNEDSHTKPADNAVSIGPSETSAYAGHPGQSSVGMPAPLAYDYGTDGQPSTSGGGNQSAVQMANVISVDGPIADAEPIPHMYFPHANATAGSSADPGVRFKDQAFEGPTSRAPHSRVPSSIGSIGDQPRTNPPPFLQQKIDRLSTMGDAIGIPSAEAYEDDGSSLPRRKPQSGPGVVLPSRRNAASDDANLVPDTETAQFKDQAQSVIGEVQAVNGRPFHYPGSSEQGQAQNFAEQSMLAVSTDGPSSADPSIIPIEASLNAAPASDESLGENTDGRVAEGSGEELGEESMIAI